jgi:pyrroline-5-carboxylate reductase
MPAEKARVFAAQAVLGAAKMVLEGEESPEQLRINVCSPNGTTLKAVDVLMEKDFRGIVEEAFDAAVARSKEMSGE